MIIALAGFSKSGKNALAEQLQSYQQCAFADALKQEVTRILIANDIKADLWGADKEEWRWLLVGWGRMRRAQDRDYWIKQLHLRIAPVDQGAWIITDLRYENELQWVQKHGGLVIGISRPGFGPANDEERESIKQIRIQYPDLPWLINDGTPRELEIAAREIIKAFYTRRCKGTSYVI
jgi:hypothetical protein